MKFLNENQLGNLIRDLIDSSLTFPQLSKKYNIGYKVLHRIASTKGFSKDLELLKKRKVCSRWGLNLNQVHEIEQLILTSEGSFSAIGRKYNVEYYIIKKIAKKYVFQQNPEKLVERIDKGRFNRESNTIGGYLKAIIEGKMPYLENKVAKKINDICQEIKNNSNSFGEIGKIFDIEKDIVGKIAKIIVYQNNERNYLERIFIAHCHLTPIRYKEIKEDLLNSGLTFNKIAKKHDENLSIIKKIAKEFIFYHNAELFTKRQECGRLGLPLKKVEEIENLILTTNRAFADLARQFNCSPESIRKITEQYVYPGGSSELQERINRGKNQRADTSKMKGRTNYSPETRDEIIDKIKNTKLSGVELSQKFGLPQSSIQWIAATQVYSNNSKGYEKRFPRLQKSLSQQDAIKGIFLENVQHFEAGEYRLLKSVKFTAKLFNAKRETVRKYGLQGLIEKFGEELGHQKYRKFADWLSKQKIIGTFTHQVLERVVQFGLNNNRQQGKDIPFFFREIAPSSNGLRPDLYCLHPQNYNYFSSCLQQEIDADFLPGQTFGKLFGLSFSESRKYRHLAIDFTTVCTDEILIEKWKKYCIKGDTLLIIGNTMWWPHGDALLKHNPDYPGVIVMHAELLGRFLKVPSEQQNEINRICRLGRNHDIKTLETLAVYWTTQMPGWDTEAYKDYLSMHGLEILDSLDSERISKREIVEKISQDEENNAPTPKASLERQGDFSEIIKNETDKGIEKLALLEKGDEHGKKVHKEVSQNTTPETTLDDPFGFGDEGEGTGFFDDMEHEPDELEEDLDAMLLDEDDENTDPDFINDENDRDNGNDIASEADREKSEEISEDSAENGDEDMEVDDGPDGDADYL